MRRSAVLVVAVFVVFVGVPSAFGQNGSDFEDVPAGHPAEGAIGWAAENGVTVGVGNNRFGVGQTLTRYQMVTFLCRAYDPSSCGSGTKGSDRFDDVPAGHWADYSVGWAVNRGITSGISATAFGGAQTLTREQMMTFLYRAEGSPAGGSNGSDVFQDGPEPGHWASLAIGWAFDEGVTGGIAAGTFGFGTNVSREEMVLFLCRTVAPGTCQPSQQPLPSSVVPTSTTTGTPDSDDDMGTGDSDESTAIERTAREHSSKEVIPDPGLFFWAFTEGRGSLRGVHPVHVFYCARQGKYTAQDLTEVVRLLNDEASPRWMKESSGLFTFVFTEGSVISPDLPWDTVDLETALPQCRARDVLDPSRDPRNWRNEEQLLLLVDTPRTSRNAAGYGGGRFATSMTLEHLGMNGFLRIVNHELGHALPGLPHDYTGCALTTLMLSAKSVFDCGALLFPHSRENLILGEWDPNSQPFHGPGLLLSCYHRRLLGWPVGGDSPPCAEQVATSPQEVTIGLHGDGYIFSWTPPGFTGGFPITGYTAVVISVEELFSVRDGRGWVPVYERRELSTEERSFVLDAPPGEYMVVIWANTKHGPGSIYKTIEMRILPSPEEVRVSELTPTSFKLDWTPVVGADYYLVSLVEAFIYEIDVFGGINVTPSVRADGTSYGATSLDGTSQLFTFLPGLVDPPQPGTEYNIRVSACRFEGDLDFFTGLNCSHGTVVTVTTPPAPPATQLPIVRGVGVEVDPSGVIWLKWGLESGGNYFEVDNPFYDPEAPDVSMPDLPLGSSLEEWRAWEKRVTGNPEMLEEWHAYVRTEPSFVIGPYREPDYPDYGFSADRYPFHPIEPDTTYETGIRACRGEEILHPGHEDPSLVLVDCSETKRVTFTSPPSAG